MDPRLLRYYNQELQHLREMGAEFAVQFPKIAARLSMDGIEVGDPYVERLLEGFAFLTGRVQLKLDAEFPRFTERLLEVVYPNYLAPLPAMLVAQLHPDLSDGNLARGYTIKRGSLMRSQASRADATLCQFQMAHDVTMWPIEIASAEYFSYAPDLPLAALPVGRKVKGGVRIKLRTTAGVGFENLELDRLRFYLSGNDEVSYKLYEFILGATVGALVCPPARPMPWYEFLPKAHIAPVGFDDDAALLPVNLRGFQGYRLLQEYYAFPQRFLFFDLLDLAPALRRHGGTEVELVLFFDRGDASLESVVDASNFALNCTPIINLFERRCDRIHVSESAYEYHVVADRTKPMDFEIFQVTEVTGFGVGLDSERVFLPLYAAFHTEDADHTAYYTVKREPRMLSSIQKRNGPRSSYIGSEVFISLVDSREAPYPDDVRQLSVTTLCTNRDLALHMPLGTGGSDFMLEMAAPVLSIRGIKGPSRPSSGMREGNIAWKFINHLSLNYLSLLDTDTRQGAAALRDLLELHAGTGDRNTLAKQIEGLRSVSVKPVVKRLPMPGLITFGRGLRVELEVDEMAFLGGSAFLFGSVMSEFFKRYASINSFTETVLRSTSRGELMRWEPRCGNRAIL